MSVCRYLIGDRKRGAEQQKANTKIGIFFLKIKKKIIARKNAAIILSFTIFVFSLFSRWRKGNVRTHIKTATDNKMYIEIQHSQEQQQRERKKQTVNI